MVSKINTARRPRKAGAMIVPQDQSILPRFRSTKEHELVVAPAHKINLEVLFADWLCTESEYHSWEDGMHPRVLVAVIALDPVTWAQLVVSKFSKVLGLFAMRAGNGSFGAFGDGGCFWHYKTFLTSVFDKN